MTVADKAKEYTKAIGVKDEKKASELEAAYMNGWVECTFYMVKNSGSDLSVYDIARINDILFDLYFEKWPTDTDEQVMARNEEVLRRFKQQKGIDNEK